jgi:hypothetical protein
VVSRGVYSPHAVSPALPDDIRMSILLESSFLSEFINLMLMESMLRGMPVDPPHAFTLVLPDDIHMFIVLNIITMPVSIYHLMSFER